ncbi:MAG TPA: protein kinase, partial [Streptomyces sp.]|nr:protein kinase [Streptomyces sp.]
MDTTLQDPSFGETPPIGQVLDGRYRVEARIAVGGMATVYRAVDTRLDRELALKVMHPSLADDGSFVARFIREAKSVARLAHPNVVGVYDQGTDGTYVYLAMEYVSGCTLRDVLRDRGALRPRVALDILEPMLAALGAAHHAGMVHRDMKPENVLIGDDGRVKVADFGLVRAVGSQTSVGSDTLLGTVSYLAPEQIEHGTADTRADLYACGVMLYEMLTGDKPHMGGTPAQVLYQHLHEEMPVPSAAVPGLAPALDALVARATAREPDGRPHDAAAMLAETRSIRAGLSGFELDAVPPQAKDAVAGLAGASIADGGNGHAMAGHGGPEDRTSVLPRPAPAHEPYGHGHDDELNRTARYAAPPPRQPQHGADGRRGGGRVFIVALAAVLLMLVGAGVWYINTGQFTKTPAV